MPTIRDLFVEIGLKVDDQPLKQFDRGIQRLEKNLRTLRRSLLLVSAAGIAGFAFLIKKGGTLEQIEIGFETMLGSAEKAQSTLAELFEFAKKTPFEVEGILATASQLIGMGFEAKDLVGILNDLGNAASGLPNASLERLALNLGQVRSIGRLTGRELKDFAIAGVPLLEELGKILGKTSAEVNLLIPQKKIPFELVRQVFKNLSSEGGRFFNLMIRQSKTTFGIFSNILDVITLLAQDISKVLLPTVKKLENQLLGVLEGSNKIVKLKLQKLIKEIIGGLKALFRILFDIGTSIAAVVEALGGLERTVQLVAISLGILFGISTLTAIGNIVLAIGKLTTAFFLMGRAGFIATLKVTALPLALGLAVVVLILLLDDLVSFFAGKKTLVGPLIDAFERDFPNAFKKTQEGLGKILESLGILKGIAKDIINFRFKIGFEKAGLVGETTLEGLKEGAVGILRSISESLRETRRRLDTGEISSISDLFGGGLTPALAPATSSVINNAGANVNQFNVDLSVSVGADNGSPEATGEAVRGVVREELGDMLQSAHKATQPQVQR